MKRDWHGQEFTAFAAIPRVAEPGFEDGLGEEAAVSSPGDGDSRYGWAAFLAVAATLGGLGVLLRRKANPSRPDNLGTAPEPTQRD